MSSSSTGEKEFDYPIVATKGQENEYRQKWPTYVKAAKIRLRTSEG